MLIGRKTEKDKIIANIQQKQPTLLTGPIGIGKTALLKEIKRELDGENGHKIIYIENISPLKSSLLETLKRLHERDELHLQGIQAGYLPWEELLKKLSRYNIKDLLTLAHQTLKSEKYILIIDHLETLTPSTARRLEKLISDEFPLVIGATNQLKPGMEKIWWRFEKIEIPPLSQQESRKLLWNLLDKNSINTAELLERQVLTRANGNPMAIIQMAQKAKGKYDLSPKSIRNLRHPAGEKTVDITPAFLIAGAMAIAARFIALGMNNTDMYIVAGISCGLFVGLRYFLYKLMRKSGD